MKVVPVAQIQSVRVVILNPPALARLLPGCAMILSHVQKIHVPHRAYPVHADLAALRARKEDKADPVHADLPDPRVRKENRADQVHADLAAPRARRENREDQVHADLAGLRANPVPSALRVIRDLSDQRRVK